MTSALDWITRLVSLDTTSRGSNLELIDLVAEELQRGPCRRPRLGHGPVHATDPRRPTLRPRHLRHEELHRRDPGSAAGPRPFPLREPVHLVLSYDEEVGCLGAAQMVHDMAGLGVRPTTCIVGEPTGMRVIAAHKSINLMELTFHGVAAHSSLTPHGQR